MGFHPPQLLISFFAVGQDGGYYAGYSRYLLNRSHDRILWGQAAGIGLV